MEEQLEFDVKCKGRIWNNYDKLSKRSVFKEVPNGVDLEKNDLDKLIRFVILYVDPRSPYSDITDVDLRVEQCINYLGYSDVEPFFRHIKTRSWFYSLLVHEYFRMIARYHYETWFSMVENFHIMNAELRSIGLDSGKRRQLTKAIPTFYEDLIKFEERIFSDDITRDIITSKATEKMLTGYAEKYAKTFEE